MVDGGSWKMNSTNRRLFFEKALDTVCRLIFIKNFQNSYHTIIYTGKYKGKVFQ